MIFESGEKVKVFASHKSEILNEAFNDFSDAIKNISGLSSEFVQVFNKDLIHSAEKGIVLGNFSENKSFCSFFFSESEVLFGSDGFCVRKRGNVLYILSWKEEGLYYGLHDLLEENCEIVYSRGAEEYDYDYISSSVLEFSKINYEKISPFTDRAINMCGIGTEGRDHRDYGSARYYARNKINHIDVYEEKWKKFGFFFNYTKISAVNIDDLMGEHPEYFMTDAFGKPKKSRYESYINYTNQDCARAVAQRFIEIICQKPERFYVWSTMPDDPFFYVKQGEVEITSLPYTTTTGVTVFPYQKNYKSTIYFDFYNTVVKEIAKIYPDVQIVTLAYLYAQEAPEVEIDEHLIVALAPISANDRYSFVDERETGNAESRANIEKWAKVCKTLSLYTYWFCFRGDIYSRPILKAVQENLLWLKHLGIKRLLLETLLECTYKEDLTERQLSQRRFYDMNELYLWAVQKLLIEPELDCDVLIRRYCKIVYKECSEQMYRYFKAVEKGYESQDVYIWYAVSGDVYTYQCILKAGVADEVLKNLEEAKNIAFNPKVKSRVESIYDIVSGEIEKYASFVDETGYINYCDKGKETILCQNQALYHDNVDSVWNKTVPLKILRNYDSLEYYDEKAKFECRMLYDKENLYISFCVFDDMLESRRIGADGQTVLVRLNGTPVLSYSETYIGGNYYNQNIYYGIISGFHEQQGFMEFYKNDGTPILQQIPEGLEDRKFAHLNDAPQNRYYVHIQVIPIKALDANVNDFTPYGSFVYYSNRYGRAGWKGIGLWSKNNFSRFHLEKIKKEGNDEDDSRRK